LSLWNLYLVNLGLRSLRLRLHLISLCLRCLRS